ncbi:MAG TPA: thiol reductant ABC exporter subunit CydC [Trueperaceae bacterium]|nr:thiol reductant ABC exporter subunit CydC [Trueperaceae bacterium]
MRTVTRLLLAHPLRFTAAVGLAAAMVLAGVGLLATSGYLIARAALHPETVLVLMVAVTGVRFFGLARAGLRYLERLVAHDLTLRVLLQLRRLAYAALLPLAPLGLGGDRSADLLGRLVEDVDALQTVGLRVVAPTIAAAVVVAVSVGLVAWVSLPAAAVTLALLLAAGAGLPLTLGAVGRRLGRREAHLRATRRVLLHDAIEGAQELWVFGRSGAFRRRLGAVDGALGRVAAAQAGLEGLREGAASLFTLAAPWAVLIAVLPQAASGTLPPLLLVPLALGVIGAFEAAQPLAEGVQRWPRAARAGERLEEVLARTPAVRDPPAPQPPPAGSTLALHGVRFAYGRSAALADVDLTLAVGERRVVVGPSGSGKSTLLRLLLRFADPAAGSVTLGGVDVRALRQEELRARVAVVPQRITLFNASVRANLALADPGAGDVRLWRALEEAELAEVVASLPAGLDALVGEMGNRLSGGERQRLGIARALLKPAPLLLLDEPTAHLDAATERRILATLLEPGHERGVLLVTHRLVGLERADEIVVLDSGRVERRGSHGDLASTEGTYRRMLLAQEGLLDAGPEG